MSQQPNVWSPEASRRLWNRLASDPASATQYFSAQVGDGIIHFLRLMGELPTHGRTLDYGCGPGYLIEAFLRAGVSCTGVDSSQVSTDAANSRLSKYKQFTPAVRASWPPAPHPEGSFDLVTCIETIEHLSEHELESLIRETIRLARPTAPILFTTPNEEDLAASYVYCPFCDSTFHKVQHVRAFSADSLAEILKSAGLDVRFCQAIDLTAFQAATQPMPMPSWNRTSLADVAETLARRRSRNSLDRLLAIKGPHLVALAATKSEPAGTTTKLLPAAARTH